MTDPTSPAAMNRRRMLSSAALGAGAAMLPSRDATAASPGRRTEGRLPPMTAQATEGPYYLPHQAVRADITEGRPGIPVDLRFEVVDETGAPYAGALVDVWHCDAQGVYSGFEEPGAGSGAVSDMRGRTFLRGVQPVDAEGVALFHTIYPGWYRGRTTHVHFKIRRHDRTNLTSQFFLPDALSEFLYTRVPAYRRAEVRDTLNSDDGIAIQAGDTVEGSVRETAGRYLVTLGVRVDRSATSRENAAGGPGSPPPGPPPGADPGRGWERRPVGLGGPPESRALEGEERVAALLPDARRVDRRTGPGRPSRS